MKKFLIFFVGIAIHAQTFAVPPAGDHWWKTRDGKAFIRQQKRICRKNKLSWCSPKVHR